MAFFTFRKRTDEPSAAPAQSESIDAMRKRARYRLIGAAVLVLVGVIGFPMLFDKQPRPIALDIPIEIPDKSKVLPLSLPAPAATDTSHQTLPVPSAVVQSEPAEKEEKVLVAPVNAGVIAPKTEATEAHKLAEKPVEKLVEKAPVKAPEKPLARSDDGAKALALLQGRAPEKKPDADEGRFVVQVGAFAEEARAREVRLKVERVGLKTYTHVAQTKDGARIRVRVGPYGNRAEAEKAADKIKKLGLSAAILTL